MYWVRLILLSRLLLLTRIENPANTNPVIHRKSGGTLCLCGRRTSTWGQKGKLQKDIFPNGFITIRPKLRRARRDTGGRKADSPSQIWSCPGSRRRGCCSARRCCRHNSQCLGEVKWSENSRGQWNFPFLRTQVTSRTLKLAKNV